MQFQKHIEVRRSGRKGEPSTSSREHLAH
jgi:hypothetical protein